MSISIEMAQQVLNACKQRAKELHSPVSITIVDAGGHLILFERMMAPFGWITGDLSIAKANTAVMFNQPTDVVAQWGATIPGFASSLAAMTQGKFVMAAGGWPIRLNGVTIGGVGVSGGNVPGRDDDIARAGVAAIERPPIPAPAIPPTPPAQQAEQVAYPHYAPPIPGQQPLYNQPSAYTHAEARASASAHNGNDMSAIPYNPEYNAETSNNSGNSNNQNPFFGMHPMTQTDTERSGGHE